MGNNVHLWGKMTENIVQAVARDCLAETLKRIDSMGLQVVFHVHDEVIIDAPWKQRWMRYAAYGRANTLGAS